MMEPAAASVEIEAATPPQLKIHNIIREMQSYCTQLRLAQYVRRWKALGWFLAVLTVVPFVVGVICGQDLGQLAAGVAVVVLAVALYCFCIKVPSSRRTVRELDRLAAEFKDGVEELKRRLEPERREAWFPSMSSRWQSLEELEERSQDVMNVVETLRSVVNLYLICELTEKLRQCQQHITNI